MATRLGLIRGRDRGRELPFKLLAHQQREVLEKEQLHSWDWVLSHS